ncbi:hypothetical protein [Paenibacillus chibensis]|uniref:hypothetical protein n=1 Tax=Paenibacillus chibensis TaxID=59846 RepID=UPI0013E2CA25|nr:hypothetical protein [Paenibacillus chibensis]MEC0372010.1 hypothetical protein [Paenibacillus chibensis]
MNDSIEMRNRRIYRLIEADDIDQAPKRFRMCIHPADHEGDTTGLAELRASASGQFSRGGLEYMKRVIPEHPITIVDLRQECHGFVNGKAMSWYGEDNTANRGLTREEVLSLEKQNLEGMRQEEKVIFDYLEGKSLLCEEEIEGPRTVQSEAELAESEGLGYYRFCVTDHHRPPDEVVDQFIQFVKALPGGTWLHFHCRGGVGRATSFILMYDMMRNADHVSLQDILRRQQNIGGRDMYRMSPNDGEELYKAAIDRLDFIRKFYEYCASRHGDYDTGWSEWLHSQRDIS